MTATSIHGDVAPGFERVRDAFAANFAEGREVGASFAVQRGDTTLVDLWGGHADRERSRPWQEQTLVNVWSTTKGLASLCIAMLVDRGKLSYEQTVASVWPEFAAGGGTRARVLVLRGVRSGGRSVVRAAALLLVLGAAPAHAAETVLVAAGSAMTWRGNASDPGLGITWTAESYTPSGWSAGSYGVGYETATGAAALIATTAPSTSYSVYTRATFSIADVSSVSNLFLGADYDDGYIAWINGVEVFRSAQMPGGTPAWNTLAGSHESSNGASPNYGALQDISTAALGAIHNGTNVLAIGVWNTTMPSSDLVLVPRLSMNADPAVTRGPYLQLGTPTSVTVRWRTNFAGDSCVRYGAAPGSLVFSACSGTTTTEHIVNVTGLDPDTTYYYSVGTSTATIAGDTADHFFTTSPPIGTSKPTRVWVLGDSGTADINAAAVRDAYLTWSAATTTDFWLMLGDNAYNTGTDSEYQNAVFNMYPTMLRRSVLWPTLGNHDGASANSNTQTGPYYDNFTLPAAAQAGGLASGTEAYYSFDYGDIHFICLDSYETDRSIGQPMLTWLEADLADTTAQWIVAFFHHPPYSKGSHDSDVDIEMVQMRENALPILEEGGVDLVLTGHSHSYERSFLIDGHYDDSPTFMAAMQKDAGSGRSDDTGAYEKPGGGPAAREGAVYVVAGSSGQVDAAPLNHPAMYVSFAELGSLVLDFDGAQLDVQFLDDLGVQQDYFTMVKTPPAPVCGNGIPEAGEECDDGNLASGDGCNAACAIDCAAAPRLDCRAAGVSNIKIVYAADPARNAVKWKWRRGAAVAVGDIGDPTVDAGYNLCFYPDSVALGAEVLMPTGAPWESRDEKGFSYRDTLATVGGVRDLRIVTGAAGRTQVSLKGLGALLPGALLPASSYTVQLVAADTGGCWSSSFATGVATATSFKGKTVAP